MKEHAERDEENKSKALANNLPGKRNKVHSPFQFKDNRPEAIAQRKLQEIINNSPQTKKAAQFQAIVNHQPAKQSHQPELKKGNNTVPSNEAEVTQRLVSSASEGLMDDRIFQNTTLTAHTKVGGKIKKISNTDFSSDFGSDNEGLAITAHGDINEVGDYTGHEIARFLTDPDTGLQDSAHNIFFQSCYAAVEGDSQGIKDRGKPTQRPRAKLITPTSVIATVSSALTERAASAQWAKVPEVEGSYGPQITTRVPVNGREGEFTIEKVVVDPQQVPIAGAIQNVLKAGIEDIKARIVLNFDNEGEGFIRQAEQDEEVVRKFKQIFIRLISNEIGEAEKIEKGILAKLQKIWNDDPKLPNRLGKQIFETGLDLRARAETVTLKPSLPARAEPQAPVAKPQGGCYITTACIKSKGLSDECEELRVLREFRDNYILKKANGKKLIDLYYKDSPEIVSAIQRRKDEEEILKRVYQVIKECVEAIKKGDNEFAFRMYIKMVLKLKEEFILKHTITSLYY